MALNEMKLEYVTTDKAASGGIDGLKVSSPDTSLSGKLAYIGQNTVAGFAGVFEGIGKLVASAAAKMSGDERLARYYAKKSYVGEWQSELAEKYSPDKVTQFIADAGAGVGQSSVFLVPGVGAAVFTAGIGGNALGEAVEKTGSLGLKEYAYAGLSAGAEMLMEKVSGSTFKAVGRVGSAVSGSVTKNATTAASKTASKGMIKAVASNGVLKNLFSEASGEFLEEFLGDYIDVGLNRLTGVDPEASTTFTQALYSGMVGFASGGFMSGGSIVINRAAAASRGYHIQESGNADTLVKTANVVLEEAQTADGFRDPLGMVDLLKQSVEAYESRADKTDYGARVALGQIQLYTAEIEKNIGVGQAYASIMNADAETMQKYAQLASLYTGEKITEQDLRANKNGIAEQMAVRDWVNGVLTVNSDIISEAEISDFTRSLYADAQQTAPRFETAEGAERSTTVDISDAEFDATKSVQNVRAADGLYLSMRRNADGTYDYRVTNTAEERADGWDARGVPEAEMRQSFEQLKQAEKTAPEAEAKAEIKDEVKAEDKKEKPRKKTEIDKATTEKLSKMVQNYTALSYTDRVAIARMVKTAEAMDVDAKTVKGVAVAMSTRRGLDIRFTDAIDQKGAWQVMEKSGRRLILINPNNTAALHQTVMHEYLHDVMGDSAKVKEAVIKATEAVGGDSFEAYIQENYDAYFDAHKKAGNKDLIRTQKDGTVTRSFATDEARERFDSMMREEAAANYGARFLARRSYLNRIADANANALVRAWNRMKRWISDVKAKDLATARMMERYTQSIAKYVGSTYAVESTMASVVRAGDGSTRYSFSSMANTFFGDEKMTTADFESRDYKQTDGYKAYVDLCLKNMKQTRADFSESAAREEIETSIDGIVKVALAMKKAGYDILDTAGKDTRDSKGRLLFSSLEPNSDYFTSHDISTICDKRKNFAEIYDAIVSKEEKQGIKPGKRFFNKVDNYFYIHKVLAEKGLTQPCRECYVESMRKNLAPMATSFVRLVNETDPSNKKNTLLWNTSGKSKGKPKETNTKIYNEMQRHLAEYGMTADQLTVDMLSTADGLAELKTTAPLIYETFNSFYGQAKPKMPKQATPFRFGELTALLTDEHGKIKKSLVDKINETGGFRFQSYSDFQIQNWADVLQVIFEAGTLGLSGHAYTKVPAFLDATAGTNLKRNISIFMYKDGNAWKLDRNDSFPMKLDEIYKLVKADKSGNTGIIAVSQNEHMSAWVMANDDIAYFIPFHKSGLKMDTVRETIVKEDGQEIRGYAGIKDHTRQQSEVWKNTNSDHKANTKVKKPISIYNFWDFDNADGLSPRDLIEKNVKRYVDECEKVGYIPRFREYIMNNGDVLKDVLRYSKELGFADKSATVSDISFEYKGYTIPYGYYKCLVDFSIFKPNGEASPHDVMSLKDYDFEKAAQTFSDRERIKRNEILQQFANGEERENYRNSGMSAEELSRVVEQKRKEIAEEIVGKDNSPRFEVKDTDTASTEIREEPKKRGKVLLDTRSKEIFGKYDGAEWFKSLDYRNTEEFKRYEEMLYKKKQRNKNKPTMQELHEELTSDIDIALARAEYDEAPMWEKEYPVIPRSDDLAGERDLRKIEQLKRESRNAKHEFDEASFDSITAVYKKYQDGTANPTNFFYKTMAKFHPVSGRPSASPDFTSRNYDGEVSSEYWYTKEGVIRGSDHWGFGVATCDWLLDVYATEGFRYTGKMYGFCNWENFVRKPSVVTVNGGLLLESFRNTIGKGLYITTDGSVYAPTLTYVKPRSGKKTASIGRDWTAYYHETYGEEIEKYYGIKPKKSEPRFDLSEDRGYSRGQTAKIVANATKSKVYSKAEAEAAIDNVTALVSDLTSEVNVLRKADIRGKSRAEVIDYLWERMNAAQEKDRLNVALNTAEYLINNAIVKEEYDGYGAEEYHRLVNDVNEISHWKKKFYFDDTVKSELRYTFDKQYKSVIGSWFSKNGFAPSVVLQKLRESGVQLPSETAVESEIFADIVAHYDNAKASLEMWNEALLQNVAEGYGKTKLKREMAHEILRAFDTMGEKSAYRKSMEAQQQRIDKLIEKQREKLKAARKRSMAEVRLFRDAIALEDLVKRNRQNHTFLQDPRVQELAKMASKIGKPRNARKPASVMTWAKGMSDIYSPTNPMMQIDGENDTYADPVVVEALRRLSQTDEKAKRLTDEQLVDLQTAVSGLKRLYTEYDTVFFEGKRVSLTETANKGIDNFRWIAEQNAKKGKRNVFLEKSGRFGKDYLYSIASPLSVIADMEMHDPNGVLTKAYQAVVNGQLRSQVQLATLAEPFERFYKENKGYRKSLARETVEFNGMTLTKAQAISLYCTMKREHARLGLETFGIQYTDANGNTVNSGKFGKVDPAALYEKLNATDKKFVEKVENFFNNVSKDVKAEADMRILGSTNVLDEYYFPILRDSMQKVGSMTDMRGMLDSLQTVARMSFNQNTVNKADGRLVIQDVTNVIDRHMQGLAIYANMYEELQSFNRIYNKNVIPLDGAGNPIRSELRSVRETLEQTHKGANRYLKKLMADIQGVRVGEVGKLEPMLNAMTGLFAQAAISGNLKTALLPMASLPAAGLHIDAKYLMKSLASDVTASEMKAAIAQMDEYSIITKGRYMNRGAIRAQSMQSEVKGLIAATGKGIEITERFMMSKIWIAAKLQTAAQTGLAVDSKENLQQAAALFDKTVTETQSQYISSMKSDMARSNNPIVRGFTMFKSDAAAMFSYNFDAFRKYAHLKEREKAGQDVKAELDAAKKQLPRAVGSMAASSIAFALIAQLVRFAFNQDDDDDKPTAQQILENSLGSMVSMFPIVADVYDYFVSGYEMSSFVLDGFNSAVGSVKSVIDLIGKKDLSQGDIAKAVRSALYNFGALVGIPVRNMTNLVTGVIRRISKPTMYAYDSLFSGEQYAKDLAAAVEKGDMKMADAVIKVMYERDKSGAYDEDTLNEVLRLYQAGYSSVLPGSVSSKVKVNGAEIDLSSDQLDQFKKLYQGADGTIQAMLKNETYNGFTDDQKAKAIKSVYTAYKSYAVYQATGQTDDKSAVMMQVLGAEKFAKARAYISGMKAAAETPKEGWKEALRKGLKSQGLSSKEISAILYAAGYRGEDELKALLSILNGKSLSSDEMKMIADILGLKVKNGKLAQGE